MLKLGDYLTVKVDKPWCNTYCLLENFLMYSFPWISMQINEYTSRRSYHFLFGSCIGLLLKEFAALRANSSLIKSGPNIGRDLSSSEAHMNRQNVSPYIKAQNIQKHPRFKEMYLHIFECVIKLIIAISILQYLVSC